MVARRRLKQASSPPITLIDACKDPNLFGGWFRNRSSWASWMVFIKAVFGLPMTEKEHQFYTLCTNRIDHPSERFREAWLVCGRRSGKSFIVSLIAVYLATFIDWSPYLMPGERGTVIIIAADRKQARVIFRYIQAFLKNVPLLSKLIERDTKEVLELSNGVNIEIHTASFRTVRGYTVVAALLDEIAFWSSEDTANPDYEILEALRPAMATIPNSMMFCASSPYSRRGVLWDAFDRYFGKENKSILVWRAPSWKMNPTLSKEFLEEEFARNPESARAEYGAEFRKDVQNFVPLEVVRDCIDPEVEERPPEEGISYMAFVDPSGGSSDSFTLAIGHVDPDTNKRVLDVIRERKPPFSPEAVVEEYAALLDSYNVREVYGDRYAGKWPAERFAAHGIRYKQAPMVKNEIYLAFLPLLNSRSVRLLDNKVLFNQLVSLDRRTGRSGRDIIDHPPGGKDDVANAVAGVLTLGKSYKPVAIW